MFAVVTFFCGLESKAEKLKGVNGHRSKEDMPPLKTHYATEKGHSIARFTHEFQILSNESQRI